ncbi:chromate transporter [Verminephrobacter aporrectodeae]|uniref:chromate transporter n=1 Tax=Verminephrobacter aporrectodeae TaxID=1110389 RepID=UPI0002377DC7|nr:chromate transporter [Verminephrobacter aporrectodeae]MCW5220732.1 chromate transporter [Verminephrobacter aporrectodeae subsp. tuberculatae]MCW5255314.1 chromate transporter [Verminephrobacter aporrectodeae subsp. tuberculatae]MCW5290027.1 chromate transporter [Verminephrobacter aporrectodeae subsp. tuberculatae]MCW8164725.1 chromate transporter [Verminephrobacter aporrectodeae subsp. tuberculatae]MCW8171279.1 chromate transporter [Verminephrobacter aporrectodeae subsp. tuberculatae]
MTPAVQFAAFGASDWLQLFLYHLSLSLLTVGGVLPVAPEMHRFLVERQAWLSDPQFSASIAIAQAAPGPNVLFVALLGWNVGINAGGGGIASGLLGALGMALCMLGVLLPSSLLTWSAARWGQRNRARRAVRAFKQGMAPVVIGLLLATAWVLARAHGVPATDWPLWLLSAASMLLVWRTRLHLLWLLGAGALLGALGWV